MDARLQLLLDGLEEGFDRRSWHGPNLLGSLRGVGIEQAVWRPGKGRHNIWELMVHAAYWKYVVRRKIRGEARGSFALKGSNFFERSQGGAAEWEADLELLKQEHAELCAAVEALDPALLDHKLGKEFTYARFIRGAAAHDLYHAGQIRLLRRLQE